MFGIAITYYNLADFISRTYIIQVVRRNKATYNSYCSGDVLGSSTSSFHIKNITSKVK